MAAIFMDGFDHYGTDRDEGSANMLDRTWAEVPGDSNSGPGVPSWGSRTGLYSIRCQTGGSGVYRYVLPATEDEVFLSFGYSCDGLPTTDNKNGVITFATAANVLIARLYVQSNGSLSLNAADNTVLAATTVPLIVSQSWHFLEMRFKRSTGVFILRVDDASGTDTPAINASGISVGASPTGQIRLLDAAASGATVGWIDDFFLRDASGGINDGWMGDRRVATLLADVDGADQGWSVNRYTKLGTGILNNTGSNFGAYAAVSAATATSLDIGAGDFTLEGFVRFQSLPSGSNKAVLFSRWGESDNQRSYELFLGSQALNNGSLCFRTSTDGTNSTVEEKIVYPWAPEVDTWYNVAIVRESGDLYLFVDGQQLGLPIADGDTYFAGSSPFGLGAEISNGSPAVVVGTNTTGWFDEVRFTNGVGRYTANYTPTTTEYPRSGTDPNWTSVALLAGFDTLIQDESTYARTLTARNNAVQQTTTDGEFAYPVIGKQEPDDNTFITAPFTAASQILTVTVNPTATQTVTVGTTDGATPAVYTFRVTASSPYDVKIGTDIEASLQNLYNAINAGPGAGSNYGAGTATNFDVVASQLPAGQMLVTASTSGTAGNSIACSETVTGSWGDTTLNGGADIPGPSSFGVERLPTNVTIVSAVQIAVRASKSDSGLGSIQTSFVGPLGASDLGAEHSLTINPVYYTDIFETDPDTAGPISPTTVNSGYISIDRTV